MAVRPSNRPITSFCNIVVVRVAIATLAGRLVRFHLPSCGCAISTSDRYQYEGRDDGKERTTKNEVIFHLVLLE